MKPTIYNFGSINIDHIYRVPHFVCPGETLASLELSTVLGGKGANQSVALARAGVNVKHIGRASVSDQWVFSYLDACGVDIEHVEQVDEASGHAIIQVDSEGENAIVLHGGANQCFDSSVLAGIFTNANKGDYLLAQNECNALAEVMSLAFDKGLNVVLNPAPMESSINALPLEQLDALIVNHGEAQMLCGLSNLDCIIDALARRLPKTKVVITLGGDGAILISNGSVNRLPASSANVVDTTGAGDTFVGYFLAGIVDGLSEVESLERACIAGAMAVETLGAIPSIPMLAELTQNNV